ncbi:MAG: tetratricopeptide repeat protein [Pseudomonadota bacterium]
MAKKKVTRKELLKAPDEFISFSARTALFIRGHSRQFTFIGVFFACLVIIYLIVTTYLGYINKRGQDAYNKAYYRLLQSMSTEKDQKGMEEAEKLFSKVSNDYGSSRVARLALPELAYIKLREKKYDEAITLYQQFLKESLSDPSYQSLTKLALSGCYEMKGDFEKAIETLKQVMAESTGSFNEQAMLNLARVYRLTNQEEKSKDILREFVKKHETSPFLPMAKAHLN